MTKSALVNENTDMDLGTILGFIRESDMNQVEAQFKIARLLAAIRKFKVYEIQYSSFKDMVEAELDFPYSTSLQYISLYNRYEALGYGREPFFKLIRQLGWRKVQFCLRKSKKRMNYKQMKEFLETNYYARDRQFNFNMSSESTARLLERLLAEHGLEINETGRRAHMAEALEGLLQEHEMLKRKGEQMDLLTVEEPAKSTRSAKRKAATPAKKTAPRKVAAKKSTTVKKVQKVAEAA